MANPDAIDDSKISVFTMMPPARFDHGDGRTEIAFIAASMRHSVAVGRHNGVLWTWGKGHRGRLGHGNGHVEHCALVLTALPRATFGEDVVSAAAMLCTTMAVTASGVLWASGFSPCFTMGMGATLEGHTFNRVGGHEHFGAGGVRSVAGSESYTLIVAQDNSLWVCGHTISNCLGRNTHGQSFQVPVRINPASFNHEPIVVASAHFTRSVVVTASGAIYTWGGEPSGTYKGLCSRVVTAHHMIQNISYLPQRVMHTSVPHVHIDSFGLWNYPLTQEELLAFLMCTHVRLGAGSPYMAAPDEMLQSIRTSLAVLAATQMGRGLRNLLGI